MFFAETLDQHLLGSFYWTIPAAATLAGAFSVAYSLRFVHDVFFNGEPIDLPKYPPHEPARYMKIPVEILVLRSEEHTSTPVTNAHLVCRLLLEKKKNSK